MRVADGHTAGLRFLQGTVSTYLTDVCAHRLRSVYMFKVSELAYCLK